MTVYVLGAGASKHVGYPLASTMGAEMLSWMGNREIFRGTADFIRETFGNSPNIEDVVTDLEALVKSLEGSEKVEDRLQRIDAGNQLGRLRVAVQVWFTEIHIKPAPAYQDFAERILQCTNRSRVDVHAHDRYFKGREIEIKVERLGITKMHPPSHPS